MTGKKRKRVAELRPAPELAFDPISAALRQLHDDIAAEGIPADFLALLDKLDGESGMPGEPSKPSPG
jgi:Anti-sigma factor NepR